MIVQQNRKSPSTVLTAHNGTGNRTFMCNTMLAQILIKAASSLRLLGIGIPSLILISSADVAEDCVAKFSSLVRIRDFHPVPGPGE